MSWIRFSFLSSLVLLHSVQAVITLAIGNKDALIGMPVEVSWTREPGDPRSFELHKFLNGEEYGLVARVEAHNRERQGHLSVNFDEQGSFTLRAFDFKEGQSPLAETPNAVNVRPFGEAPNPSDPTTPRETPSIAQGPSSAATPTPSATSTATSTSSQSTTTSSLTGSNPPRINAAAIAGGVIGGVLVFALLVLGILLLIRKRRAAGKGLDRRFSFHRDLMIQARPNNSNNGNGNVTIVTHTQRIAGESSPRLPRFSFQRRRDAPSAAPLAQSFTPAHAGPTERQLLLSARVRQLEEMMHDIRYRPGMSRVLEQLRGQVSWLRSQRNSPWALHETDEKPLHYELYMTS